MTIQTRVNRSDTLSVTALEPYLDDLVALRRVGRELNSTLDMDQVLSVLIAEAVRVTEATHGGVFLVDERSGNLQLRAWYGYTARRLQAFEPQSVVARVLATGRVQVIDDVRHDSECSTMADAARSVLAVPVVHGEEMVGVLSLESPLAGAFDLRARHLVLALAEQAAIAVGNARRYAEQVERETLARQRNAQLRNLIAISHELHAEHTLEDVLDQIVQAIPATVGFNVAMLSLVEGEPPVLRRVAAAGIPLDTFRELQRVRQPLSTFESLMRDRYRVSRSYFFPHQEVAEWGEELNTYTLLKDNGSWEEGRWHPHDMLLVPLRDSKGNLLGMLSVDDPQDGMVPGLDRIEILELFAHEAASAIESARLHDELEMRVRRRTEELAAALRRQAIEIDKTRAIVESISDAVVVFAPDGEVVLANPATARVLGLEPRKLLHRNVHCPLPDGLSPKDREVIAALFATVGDVRASLEGGTETVETVFEAGRRSIHASFSSVALRDTEPLTVVAVLRDITDEVESERIKSEFLSMAAHELRVPMTSISGYVDLMMLGMLGPVNEKQSEFLQVVKANAERLMTLVNDLLDISRIEGGEFRLNFKSISLAEVISEVADSLQGQLLAKDQKLIVDVPPDMPRIMADRDRMIQVMTNLLSNAHKYSPAGSEITIRGRQMGDHLRIDVCDHGIGISKEDQKRLFTRFFRADNAIATQENGTGLGLAICREIVSRHGGEIMVQSELGKGSTFSVVLPIGGACNSRRVALSAGDDVSRAQSAAKGEASGARQAS